MPSSGFVEGGGDPLRKAEKVTQQLKNRWRNKQHPNVGKHCGSRDVGTHGMFEKF